MKPTIKTVKKELVNFGLDAFGDPILYDVHHPSVVVRALPNGNKIRIWVVGSLTEGKKPEFQVCWEIFTYHGNGLRKTIEFSHIFVKDPSSDSATRKQEFIDYYVKNRESKSMLDSLTNLFDKFCI